MSKFKVTWTIDIEDVDTAREAAVEAWDHMQREGSIANYFTVNNSDTGESVDIDLTDVEEPINHQLKAYAKLYIDNMPQYSPECFDGRFFKWGPYVLDSMTDGVIDAATLYCEGVETMMFHCPIAGYENDQEKYLNDMLETAKRWIDEQDLPDIIKEQNA